MSKALVARDSALILIDQQIISMSFIKTQSAEVAKYNSLALAKAARVLNLPNVWTSSTEDENEDWWMPGLKEINPDAYARRVKRTGIVNAWSDPHFLRAVEATGRRTLIMAGTTNDGCLLYAALGAKRAGFDVQAVLDAAGSAFEISETAARLRMMHEGIVLTAANTVIGELAEDWSSPPGQQLRQVLGELLHHTVGAFDLKA